MIVFTSVDTLSVNLSSVNAVDVVVSFVDTNPTTFVTTAGRQRTNLTAIGNAVIMAAPAAGVERVVKEVNIQAQGGANNLIVFYSGVGTFVMLGCSGVPLIMAQGDSLQYTDTEGWRRMNSLGKIVFDVPVAAGASTPSGTGFRHVTAGVEDAASKLVDTADINNLQVTAAKIANTTITAAQIANTTITATQIANTTITATQIANNTITATQQAQMAANTVKANPTAALANESDLAVGTFTVVGRAAGNIVAAPLVDGQIAGNTITAAAQVQMAANSVKANPTAGVANESDLAIAADSIVARFGGNLGSQAAAVQSTFIKAAGNLFNATSAAGQSLRRSIAGGDLGFSAAEERALGVPITANAAATNATTNVSCTGSQSIPANSTIVGSTFTLRGWFSLLHTTVPPTLTAEVLVNGAVVATAIMTVSTTAATHAGCIDGVVTIRTTGAGGTAMAQVHFDTNFSIANSVDGSVGTATFAIDTTVARTLELRVRQTTAGPATTTLTATNGFIQRIS